MTAEMSDSDLAKLDATLYRRHRDGTLYNEIYGADEVRALRERLRRAEEQLPRPLPGRLSQADEDAIELAYWKFDTERNATGVERDAFKGQLRLLIRRTRAAAADVVKHLSHEDGIGMGSQRIEKAITEERGD